MPNKPKKRPVRRAKKKTAQKRKPKKKQNGTGYASDAWDYVGKNKGNIAMGALIGGHLGLGLLAGTAMAVNGQRADFARNQAPALLFDYNF